MLCVYTLLSLLLLVNAQIITPGPAVAPLLSRSPSLNLWVNTVRPTTATKGLAARWPTLWMGQPIHFSGLVRVDNKTYVWQGDSEGERVPGPAALSLAETSESYITPTRTIFTISAGTLRFNVTYLNPIEPEDPVRQSFPFSLVIIDGFTSLDRANHTVQFEFDSQGESLTSVPNAVTTETTRSDDVLHHQMTLSTGSSMSEQNDVVEDGMFHLAILRKPYTTSWEVGNASTIHRTFDTAGMLGDIREILTGETDWYSNTTAIGLAVDVGTVTAKGTQSNQPIVLAVGHTRDATVLSIKDGSEKMHLPYFLSHYSNLTEAIQEFMGTHDQVLSRAVAMDDKLTSAAQSISPQYADLATLAARLMMGSLDITYAASLSSEEGPAPRTFMKDIGRSRRVNAVETLYAAFPGLLYMNPGLAGTLLEPLLDVQDNLAMGGKVASAAAPDMGTSYPDATGNPTLHASHALEHSSSMLIMALAHAQKSGDGSLLVKHHNLFKTWANRLIEITMGEATQETVDGLSHINAPNNANLALKGIIAIHAMSMINQAVEANGADFEDTVFYAYQAKALMEQWKAKAVKGDHIASNLDDPESWGMIYNLYAGKLIGSELVDVSVLEAHTKLVGARIRESQLKSHPGIPFDSTPMLAGRCRTDWSMFVAATLTDKSMSDELYALLREFAYSSSSPWSTEYYLESQTMISGRSSPALGATFAPLALTMANRPIRASGFIPLTGSDEASRRKRIGTISGAVVGSFIFVGLIMLAMWYHKRGRALWARRVAGVKTRGYGYVPEVGGTNGEKPIVVHLLWGSDGGKEKALVVGDSEGAGGQRKGHGEKTGMHLV